MRLRRIVWRECCREHCMEVIRIHLTAVFSASIFDGEIYYGKKGVRPVIEVVKSNILY